MIYISSGVLLVAVLALGGAYWYHTKKAPHKPAPLTLAELSKLQVNLPQVMTNTRDGHLVQATFTIQTLNQQTYKDVTAGQAQILDIINTSIHGENGSEFLSQHGLENFKLLVLGQIRKLLPVKDEISQIDVVNIIEQ